VHYLINIIKGLTEAPPPKPRSLCPPRGFTVSPGSPQQPVAPVKDGATLQGISELLSNRERHRLHLVAETGTSWFTGFNVRMHPGDCFIVQMQYGSIGWSLPASIGYAMALDNEDRCVCLIGDGSFQLTAQALATAARYKDHVTNLDVVLVNNGRYVIEDAIHHGNYNIISKWNYGEFAKSVGFVCEGTEASCWKHLSKKASGHRFFDVEVCAEDVPNQLKTWGKSVHEYNTSPCTRAVPWDDKLVGGLALD